MKERTIMIFPNFHNIEKINEIRKKYDPLSNLVRPHITLVFPFKSELTTENISEQIETAVKGISPFALELCGFSTEQSKFGNYLFLNITKGAEYLNELNRRLYNYHLPFPYNPHMTVGKVQTIEQLEAAYSEVSNSDEVFTTIVDTISVEIIGEHGESIIEIEKTLR